MAASAIPFFPAIISLIFSFHIYQKSLQNRRPYDKMGTADNDKKITIIVGQEI
jgi:hypothetical protein